MYNVEHIRKDFPILEREVNGWRIVYLDNAATSQKPKTVIEELTKYYERYNANVHRGLHTLAEEATVAYERSRGRLAAFINAESPSTVIFTRNTTESINLLAYAWGRRNLKAGDEIILSVMEHHSNIVPWQILAEETGVVLRYIDINEEGQLDMEQYHKLLGPRTKLVSVMQVSNVLGTINPVKAMAKAAHDVGALMLVDGAQSVPNMPVDVQDLDCDFMAFSSHKMMGPTGIGALYGKPELLEPMGPFLGGGEMIREVTLERTTWNELPWRFEAGTPNIADAVALLPAVDYLNELGLENIRQHEIELTAYALQKITALKDITVYGPPKAEDRGGVVAFTMGNVHPHDIGTALDQYGIAVRAGHHCAQPLHRRLGLPSTARASFYAYNTFAEVDQLIEGLVKTQEFFSRVAGRTGRTV